MKLSSRQFQRGGMSVLEVSVCVGCLVILAVLLLPWLLKARGQSRDQICETRARALAEAALLYADDHQNHLPYLVEDAGWPSALLPYLNVPGSVRDRQALSKEELEKSAVPQLVCPDDPRMESETGALSYVMNGGYGLFPVEKDTNAVQETGKHSAGIDLDGDGEVSAEEWSINYATGVIWRPDARGADGFRMSLPWLSEADGQEFTLLLAENLNAGAWSSQETRDLAFVIGRERLTFAEDEKSRGPLDIASANLGPFAINGNLGTLPGQCPAPSSLHGDYVHVMYGDGRGGALSANIDPLAYAGLMSSNGTKFGQGGSAPVANNPPAE